MKPWMQSAAVGAALLVFAGLLAYRSMARVEAPHALATEPTLPDPLTPNTALMERIAAKSRIAKEVIDGRRSLLQAAADFRDADADESPPPTVMMAFSQSASVDEAYCRSVIAVVAAQAPPERADALIRDLNIDLSTRLGDGTLHLPDAAPAGD